MECKDEEKVRKIRSFPHEIGLQNWKASNEKKFKVKKFKVWDKQHGTIQDPGLWSPSAHSANAREARLIGELDLWSGLFFRRFFAKLVKWLAEILS